MTNDSLNRSTEILTHTLANTLRERKGLPISRAQSGFSVDEWCDAMALAEAAEVYLRCGEIRYNCPYCGKELHDERSACCGEVGHAEKVAEQPDGIRRAAQELRRRWPLDWCSDEDAEECVRLVLSIAAPERVARGHKIVVDTCGKLL